MTPFIILYMRYKPSFMLRPIGWICVLFLLCHTACNGCKQREIEQESIDWGAVIAINPTNSGVTPLGSINGFPVLGLSGTISKNVPGVDTAFLCALFVPDGSTPHAGATAIQGHTVKRDAQDPSSNGLPVRQLHALDGGSFVYYECPLDPNETGSVDFSVASLDADHSLVLGTTYNIYLGIKIGPHFFYSSHTAAGYTFPDTASLTQVTMVGAQCEYDRDTDGKVLPKLSAEATVANMPGSGAVGFLFLKQGTGLTPMVVLSNQLKTNSSLSAANDTLTAHINSDVVICGATAAENFTVNEVQDTTGVLEKGATYDVYGYIKDGNNHVVSDNSQAVTLPAVEIQVAMESVGAPSLLAMKANSGAEYDVPQFALEVTGEIEKIDNAKDPVAGFVFVKNDPLTDKAAICQAIAGAISNTSTVGDVVNVNNSKNYVVCVAKTAGVGTIQTITYTCDLKDPDASKLDLSSDYTVYCWVKDAGGAGELFLSNYGQELKVFYVAGEGITAVNGSYAGNQLTIDCQVDHLGLRNVHGAEMATCFLKDPGSLDLEALRAQYEQRQGASRFSSCGENSQNRCYFCGPYASGVCSIQATNASDLEADTEYTLGLVVRQENVLYYMPSTCGYDSPKCIGLSSLHPIVTLDDDRKIELELSSGKAYHIHNDGKNLIKTEKEKHKRIIRAALDRYYSAGDTRNNAYQEFGLTED